MKNKSASTYAHAHTKRQPRKKSGHNEVDTHMKTHADISSSDNLICIFKSQSVSRPRLCERLRNKTEIERQRDREWTKMGVRGQMRMNVIHPWIAVKVAGRWRWRWRRCRLRVGVPHANMTLMTESTSNNLHPSQRAIWAMIKRVSNATKHSRLSLEFLLSLL